MNKFIKSIILFFAFSFFAFGQTEKAEKFEYKETGINDFIVTKVEGKSTNEIYNKTINWIKETYKNPDIVIKMRIENEKVRINGVASDLLFVRNISLNLDYVIEISVKDNKYKFELISLTATEQKTDYKKIPNFKTDSKLIKNFGESPNKIENYLNGLNESLRIYILSDKKNNDW